MFKRDFKFAAGAGCERGRVEDGARFAKDDLMEFIGKLDGQLDALESTVASIHDFARQRCYFLMQKVLRAAHIDIFNVDLRGVGLLGGTEEELCAGRVEMAPPAAGLVAVKPRIEQHTAGPE